MFKSAFFTRPSYLIFPIAILAIYFLKIFTRGTEIQTSIPGFYFLGTLLVMFLLEFLFKYKKSVSQNDRLPRDFTSTLVNLYATGPIGAALFVPAVIFMPELLFGRTLFFGSPVDIGPFWVQIILAVLLLSFLRYAIHYFQHKNNFLWQLHSYHHSITDLKAINTLVSHPIDFSLRNILPPIIVAAIGFDVYVVFFGTAVLTTFSGFSHCGAGLNAGWLNKIFVTPELHRWHHTADVPKGHKYAVNYGVGFIVWDRLFGTYYLPMEGGVPVQPDRLGNPSGYADEKNYFKLLFLTRYWPKFGGDRKEV